MSNARMRHARKQALIRLSRAIEKLADRADKLDATLPNGGLVGALLFTMAFDILETTKDHENDDSKL